MWDGDRTLGYALVPISAATMLAKGDEFPLKSDDPEAEAALARNGCRVCLRAHLEDDDSTRSQSSRRRATRSPGQESAQAESHSERKAAPAAAASPLGGRGGCCARATCSTSCEHPYCPTLAPRSLSR